MRVMLITGSYPPAACGVGDYTMRLGRALAVQPGWEVAVITGSTADVCAAQATEKGEVTDPVFVHRVANWSFATLPRIVTTIRRWSPDVVHIQYPTQGFFGWRLPTVLPVILRCLGFPSVQTWHEPPPRGLRAMAYFLLPRLGARALVFVRPRYLDYFSPRLRCWIAALPQATIPNTAALPLCQLDAAGRAVLRDQWRNGRSRLIVFFGFITREKGIEQIFDIASADTDQVVIAGRMVDAGYVEELKVRAGAAGWQGNVVFPGFLAPNEAAGLLAVADAVVLPFLNGGGGWNTSIHSAVAQGSLVITTGIEATGDDPLRNVYVAALDGVAEMRAALDRLAGRKIAPAPQSGWQEIAAAHLSLYGRCLRSLRDAS